ncbi:hypothetical protein [uncultured Winogradskyella sp.]|uniref:hypothetical protein n=1 Tax=uncultured Winogradskyella sp. TaxID=395353 RepID=UPI0030D8BEA4|tara:strand:- start:19525 stop:20841 length:1317 start_codon:yes stop_codon:yes gene_type:complete
MKKITQTAFFVLVAFGPLFAQQEKGIVGYNNWLNTWTEFKPNKVEYGEPTQILSGNISENTKLLKRDVYLLLGDVFVTDSSTLTIEAGTVILGDFKTKGSLTISNGSRILAEGTQTDPIIFTSSRGSRKPGDWGGVFILGDAPLNTFGNGSSLNNGLRPSEFSSISYGGEDSDSNSGIIKYVRIEYAGKKTIDYGNFSALTLAGVGNMTVIRNVMVSYSEGDAFNIFGGNTRLEQLVSYKASQNDYKFNYGAQSNLYNSLAIRSPYISSSDGSRCLYISSYDDKESASSTKKSTEVVAENLTLVNISDDLQSDIKVGLVQEAIFIDKDTSFLIDKSVISGFNPAVVLDGGIKINNENLQKIQFQRTYFNNCNGNIFVRGDSNNDDLESWYGSRSFNNVYSKGPDSETFIDAQSSRNPDFRLRINGIIASNDLIDDDED